MADKIDLVLDQSSIKTQLMATLKEVAFVHSMESAESLKIESAPPESFSDGWEKQGLVNTAEALECFFIPYFSVKGVREAFWNDELIKIDHIRSAIEYLVLECKNDSENDGLNSLSGTPYMNFKLVEHSDTMSGIERNLDFLDTACFVLPCLLDAKAIDAERDIMLKNGLLNKSTPDLLDSKLLEAVDERISATARMLQSCDLGPGYGWTYTDDPLETDKQDHLYFTWNALEALELLIKYLEKAPHLIPKEATDVWGGTSALDSLKALFREKQSYLAAAFLSADNKKLYICETRVDFGNEDSNWYYNVFAVLSLLISGYSDKNRLTKAFTFFLKNLKGMTLEKARKKEHGVFLLEGSLYGKHKKDWSERALTPLIIKAMARLNILDGHLLSDVIEPIEEYDSSEQLLNKYLQQLGDERINLSNSKICNLWANLGGESIYSIYYTQRSVEALTTLYSCLAPTDQIKPYYTSSHVKPLTEITKEIGVSSQINISITPEIISESILDEIEKQVKKKIMEILNSDDLLKLIGEKLVKEDDNTFKTRIDDFFDYLIANCNSDNPDKNYKKSLDALTTLIGKQLNNAICVMLHDADPDVSQKMNKADFNDRFKQGLRYLVEWETRAQGPIDYGKTLSELHAKKLVQFITKNQTSDIK